MHPRGRIALLTFICLSIVTVTLAPSLLATPGGVASSNQLYDCGGSCHNKPSTASITMWASAHQVAPGGLVDVIVNVSGGQAVNILGVMIVSVASPVQASNPTAPENGWVIRSDPVGGTFNYYENTTYSGSTSMRWQLDAPLVMGSYTLYARMMHGGGAAYAADYSAGVSFLVGTISTTGPTVLVTAPATGAEVKGVVPIETTVLGNASLRYVVLKLDGVEIANKTTGPFTWSLESTIYKDGVHTLNVTAVDVNGKVGYHEITITINNAGSSSGLLAWVWTMAAGTVAILAWIGVLMVVALMVRRRHVEGGMK
jgi:hypothetical protein